MLPEPNIHYLNERLAVLVEEYCFSFEYKGVVICQTIPAGFIFDGATIPRIFWTITGLTPFGAHNAVTLIHDFLYSKEGVVENTMLRQPLIITRVFVDKLFKQHLRMYGFNEFQLQTIYAGTRLGGYYFWREW